MKRHNLIKRVTTSWTVRYPNYVRGKGYSPSLKGIDWPWVPLSLLFNMRRGSFS